MGRAAADLTENPCLFHVKQKSFVLVITIKTNDFLSYCKGEEAVF